MATKVFRAMTPFQKIVSTTYLGGVVVSGVLGSASEIKEMEQRKKRYLPNDDKSYLNYPMPAIAGFCIGTLSGVFFPVIVVGYVASKIL
jgi:hypothetical protein